MYQELYEAVADRLNALLPANVAPALGADPPLPACQPYLAGDRGIKVNTTRARELTWVIKVSVGHSDLEGAAQDEIMALLDTIRDGFDNWQPDGHLGLQGPFRVKEIRIEDFQDHGNTVYLVILTVRVIPAVYEKI